MYVVKYDRKGNMTLVKRQDNKPFKLSFEKTIAFMKAKQRR